MKGSTKKGPAETQPASLPEEPVKQRRTRAQLKAEIQQLKSEVSGLQKKVIALHIELSVLRSRPQPTGPYVPWPTTPYSPPQWLEKKVAYPETPTVICFSM